MRVIIADDSTIMLDRLQQLLLGLKGVELVGAFGNGTDALSALQMLKPDLAILDNKMPGMKGVDIIREIRKEDSKMKLVLLTFYTDTYYREQAMNAGADYFFSKSDDFEKIPELVDQLRNNGMEKVLLPPETL
jgi:DNA-binding NarL/FixJ family response regulator